MAGHKIDSRSGVFFMYLTEMKIGEPATIVSYEGFGQSEERRLYDMGIAIGSTVVVLHVLSRGRLYIITVDDVDFCLRAKEAQKIRVVV